MTIGKFSAAALSLALLLALSITASPRSEASGQGNTTGPKLAQIEPNWVRDSAA